MKKNGGSRRKKNTHHRKAGFFVELGDYLQFLRKYSKTRIYTPFSKFESGKDVLVGALYKKRGKYSRPLLHLTTVGVVFAVIIGGPLVLEQNEHVQNATGTTVLSAAGADEVSFYTMQAEEVRQFRGGEVVAHRVNADETLEDIATRYNLHEDTIRWENNLGEKEEIKEGDTLRILPVDGVRHKSVKGDTIFTVAKKYGLEDAQAQMIVDYPFNEFQNDETFALMVGQYLMVPGGIMPKATTTSTPRAVYSMIQTPDAGSVTAAGQFVWPASGGISQGYSVFHKAVDISNLGGGAILAADSGVVTASGWDSSGYGNRVVVDHGNGYVTLYAHMSSLAVNVGQSVGQGNVLGQMGSTGRSTGVHLHFEIRTGGGLLNPLDYLR